MARAFASASSQYLEYAGAVVTATPLTMACWAQVNNITANHWLMALADSADGDSVVGIRCAGAVANDPIQARLITATGSSAIASINNYPGAGTWFHAAGVFASATSRFVYLDGTQSTESTTNRAMPTVDRTSIGRKGGLTAEEYLDGRAAEAGIWNVALTANEIASLAKGASPLMIRPNALVAYWPLHGRFSPEPDWFGASTPMTVTSATQAAHPPKIVYPARPQLYIPAAAAGGLVGPLIWKGELMGGALVNQGRLLRN